MWVTQQKCISTIGLLSLVLWKSGPWSSWLGVGGGGAVLCFVGSLAAFLASTHWTPVSPLSPQLWHQNVSRHFQISSMGKISLFKNCYVWCVCELFSCGWLFATPRNSLCKNTGVGCHSPLQRIFPTQGLNLGLPHWRQILHCLSPQGSTATLQQTLQRDQEGFRHSQKHGMLLYTVRLEESRLQISVTVT